MNRPRENIIGSFSKRLLKRSYIHSSLLDKVPTNHKLQGTFNSKFVPLLHKHNTFSRPISSLRKSLSDGTAYPAAHPLSRQAHIHHWRENGSSAPLPSGGSAAACTLVIEYQPNCFDAAERRGAAFPSSRRSCFTLIRRSRPESSSREQCIIFVIASNFETPETGDAGVLRCNNRESHACMLD